MLGSLAGVASAQSSVTLFGLVDVGVRQVKGAAGTVNTLSSDGRSSSRLGVRGVEDLGGGLKASFWIEAPLSADTGTSDATRFWNRRATVSLSGAFGEVRLGRHKVAARLTVDDFDPYSTTGTGAVNAIFSGLGSKAGFPQRVDNQVGYVLPGDLGGVYGGADVAAGEGAATDGNKSMSARLGYKAGPLHVAGAFSVGGVSNNKYKFSVIAGSYDFGVAKASLMMGQNKFDALKQGWWQVGAVVPVGSGEVLLSYADANANAAAEVKTAGDAKLFALGYNHILSKRTTIYATLSQIKNEGLAKFVVAGGNAVNAGGTSRGADVGIRHSF
ncbi:porin [Paucibacter soli]|uniref:porin n=1 Tax=Paucibacter soli TaxID=3133433 RepID=UPI003099B36B